MVDVLELLKVKKISVLFIVIAVFFLAFLVWWRKGLSAVNSKDTSTQVFVIPRGEPVRNIGNKLKNQNLIRDPVVFFIFVKLNNLERNIQAGSYKLSPSMDLERMLKTFKSGSEDVWITIPEGYRAAEIAEVIKKEISTFEEDWVESLENEEGYLFPDTYLIPKDADISTIISIFKNTFNKKIESIGLSPTDPGLHEVVIVASLIEREAFRDDEKVLISSVINNRLREGMALDIDATLQYVKGKNGSSKWWSVPTVEDRKLISSYNTYTNSGIPPGPIANPGLESIRAASDPAESDYYFYIHDPKGNVHFAKTLAEHNRNVEKYLN